MRWGESHTLYTTRIPGCDVRIPLGSVKLVASQGVSREIVDSIRIVPGLVRLSLWLAVRPWVLDGFPR